MPPRTPSGDRNAAWRMLHVWDKANNFDSDRNAAHLPSALQGSTLEPKEAHHTEIAEQPQGPAQTSEDMDVLPTEIAEQPQDSCQTQGTTSTQHTEKPDQPPCSSQDPDEMETCEEDT